jgi:hypothetical protein
VDRFFQTHISINLAISNWISLLFSHITHDYKHVIFSSTSANKIILWVTFFQKAWSTMPDVIIYARLYCGKCSPRGVSLRQLSCKCHRGYWSAYGTRKFVRGYKKLHNCFIHTWMGHHKFSKGGTILQYLWNFEIEWEQAKKNFVKPSEVLFHLKYFDSDQFRPSSTFQYDCFLASLKSHFEMKLRIWMGFGAYKKKLWRPVKI